MSLSCARPRFWPLAAFAFLTLLLISTPATAGRSHHDRMAGDSEHFAGRKTQSQKIATSLKAAGVFPDVENGLALDIWTRLSTDAAVKLIANIPTHYQSAVQRRLAQHALLHAAWVPKDAQKNANKLARFTAARMEKLLEMGAPLKAAALYNSVPQPLRNDSLKITGFETALYAGLADTACLEAFAFTDRHDNFWQQAHMVCAIYTGSLQPEDESVVAPENPALAWFLTLENAKTRKSVRFTDLNSKKLAAYALSPAVPLKNRLKAAVYGAKSWLIDSEVVESVFAIQPFKAESLQNQAAGLQKISPKKAGPRTHAMLYRASILPGEKSRKYKVLKNGLHASSPLYSTLSENYTDAFLDIPADSSHISLAFSASFLLYMDGFYDNAALWRDLIKTPGETSTNLLPYVLITEGLTPSESSEIASWSRAMSGQLPSGDTAGRVQRVISTLRPFGFETAGDSEADAREGENEILTSHKAALDRLKRASQRGQKAETLLRALGVLNGQSPKEVNPDLLEAVLTALRKAGLDQEARLIAVEVIAANVNNEVNE